MQGKKLGHVLIGTPVPAYGPAGMKAGMVGMEAGGRFRGLAPILGDRISMERDGRALVPLGFQSFA